MIHTFSHISRFVVDLKARENTRDFFDGSVLNNIRTLFKFNNLIFCFFFGCGLNALLFVNVKQLSIIVTINKSDEDFIYLPFELA